MLDLNNLEQPKNARSWHTPTLEAIEGYDAIFDQFNVLLDEYGEFVPIRKGTKLRCTDETMAIDLTVPCPGCPRHSTYRRILTWTWTSSSSCL